MTTINWTPLMLGRLKVAYNKAEAVGAPTFMFEGHEFVTQYAKYLIEHLDNEFAKRRG